MRDQAREALIRARAFELWEAEGRPHGRHETHWFHASETVRDQARGTSSGDENDMANRFRRRSPLKPSLPAETTAKPEPTSVPPVVVPPAPAEPAPALVVAPAPPKLRGHLDAATPTRIAGWVRNLDSPDTRVTLILRDNGVEIGRTVASQYRADLERKEIGDGTFGYVLFPSNLAPGDHRFELLDASTLLPVPQDPQKLADLARLLTA